MKTEQNKSDKETIEVDLSKLCFMAKSGNTKTWNNFNKKTKEERYEFLSKRRAMACPVMDRETLEDFYYPELQGVKISLNNMVTRYKTSEEALEISKAIKKALKESLIK